jgi:hypothetical protein
MHPGYKDNSGADHFYGSPELIEPSFLGIAAEFPAASAIDFARKLESQPDTLDD